MVNGCDKSLKSLWTAKYRPNTLKEIVGHPTAVRKISNWLKNWRPDLSLIVELPSVVTPLQAEDLVLSFKNKFPNANIQFLDSKIRIQGTGEEEKQIIVGIEEVLEEHSVKKTKVIIQPKALLLEGPPGVGKTALVEALAQDFNLELIEFNASDTRNQERIRTLLTVTSKTRPLNETFKGQLLLMDEVDGLSGNEDRGGAGALIKIIQQTRIPLILTANVYDRKLQTLYG
ncbi:MAG: AAA family ATPase, partial [Promethearchaeota archaeon]